MGWVWTRHGFRPCDSVPLSDRGFRYGMSVFESLRVRGGRPLFLKEHLQRLSAAAAQTGLALDSAVFGECGALLNEDGFARIYVTAGDGPATSGMDQSRVFIFNEPREPLAPETHRRGYDLGLAAERHQPLFNGLKTANYWANLDALRRGLARKKNETLLFNQDGHLISACMANVFHVTGGKLKTPARGGGTRAGVVREWVLLHHAVEEAAVTRKELDAADEVFLTSSWLGVMPVVTLEGRRLEETATARTLLREYEAVFNTESTAGNE